MIGFTSLEIAVLTAISSGHMNLSALLDTAQMTERENTGHGFYTDFSVDRRLSASQLDRQSEGLDAYAHMSDMGDGMVMAFVLWFDKNGYPHCLEGFQYSDSQGNTVDLKTRDLTTLAFTQLYLSPPPSP